jgi:glutamine amidotransferase
MQVGVVDYGSGNLGSMLRALEELNTDPRLITDPAALDGVQAVILPGVGNFTDAMQLLHGGGWVTALKQAVVTRGCPLLGVCVGMQLLAECGDEGAEHPDHPTPGLGLVGGRVRHLRDLGCNDRIPHVGWNAIDHARDALFDRIRPGTDFYFVHSYAMSVTDPVSAIATVGYGARLTAAVRAGRVMGTQFHPEKSGRAGFVLLRNFLEQIGC